MAVVLCAMYASALVVTAVTVLAVGDPVPDTPELAAGLGAGLFGIFGLACFYRALSTSTMSIVAPISATGVAIPVVVGLLRGDAPSTVTSAGLVIATVGVILASREAPPEDRAPSEFGVDRETVALSLAAGVGFGLYFVCADIASEASVSWALLLSRTLSTPILLGVVIFVVGVAKVPRERVALLQLAGIGMLDLGANVLFNVASTMGALSGVAVAAALYPVVTVLLAAAVLHERVRGIQFAGVVAALAGVVMIAAG